MEINYSGNIFMIYRSGIYKFIKYKSAAALKQEGRTKYFINKHFRSPELGELSERLRGMLK